MLHCGHDEDGHHKRPTRLFRTDRPSRRQIRAHDRQNPPGSGRGKKFSRSRSSRWQRRRQARQTREGPRYQRRPSDAGLVQRMLRKAGRGASKGTQPVQARMKCRLFRLPGTWFAVLACARSRDRNVFALSAGKTQGKALARVHGSSPSFGERRRSNSAHMASAAMMTKKIEGAMAWIMRSPCYGEDPGCRRGRERHPGLSQPPAKTGDHEWKKTTRSRCCPRRSRR